MWIALVVFAVIAVCELVESVDDPFDIRLPRADARHEMHGSDELVRYESASTLSERSTP